MANDQFQEIVKKVSSMDSSFIEGLIPCGKLSVERALSIYSNAYRVRMSEALGETFKVVWWCLGDEVFFSICREFILKSPSTFYNLAQYGEKFPEFLESQPVSVEMPFLKHLALFEWQFKEIFHCAEEKSLDQSQWQTLASIENPKFIFTAQLKFLTYPYGIRNIWRSFKNAFDEKSFKKPDWKISQNFLIYKKDHEVFLKDLEIGEFEFLTRLSQGNAFENAASGLELKEKNIKELFEFLFTHSLVANISG
ncbi:MAG: DNA-binding domain-containing protein [Pseudomonadota bacterium]|nr:DNA-binding domain-containing protein [Pseudomonadota bacterium]